MSSAVPCRAVPCRAVPCRAVPCRAVQQQYSSRQSRVLKPFIKGTQAQSMLDTNHPPALDGRSASQQRAASLAHPFGLNGHASHTPSTQLRAVLAGLLAGM
jgi:hypothetical protein